MCGTCVCVCVFSGRIVRKKSASEMCFCTLCVLSPLPAGLKKSNCKVDKATGDFE